MIFFLMRKCYAHMPDMHVSQNEEMAGNNMFVDTDIWHYMFTTHKI